MKHWITIAVRSLMGALFLFGSVAYFAQLVPEPELTGNMKVFNEGLKASQYLMPLAKAIELVAGIALLTGQFVPLAILLLSPIIVNIFFIHTFLDTTNFAVGLVLVIINSYLGYVHWDRFKEIFRRK